MKQQGSFSFQTEGCKSRANAYFTGTIFFMFYFYHTHFIFMTKLSDFHRISQFVNSAVTTSKEVTTASIRKAIVTTVHAEGNESEKSDLSSMMCHRLETANKFYYINKRRQEAIRAAMLLKKQRKSSSTTSASTTTPTKAAILQLNPALMFRLTRYRMTNSCKYIVRISSYKYQFNINYPFCSCTGPERSGATKIPQSLLVA